MRDTRKNKEYFDEFIEYQYSRINKKTKKLQEADDTKKQRILVSLVGFEVDLLKAEFSIGATSDKIKKLLVEAIDVISEYKNITYEDLLNILSIAIIVNSKNDTLKLIENNRELISNDRLLNYLASYICGVEAIWDKTLPLPDVFSYLDNVFNVSDKESALRTYLDEWYRKHSGYAWYDSHLGSSDTYCGYWSFESAAIAKVLELQEADLQKSVYYPCL